MAIELSGRYGRYIFDPHDRSNFISRGGMSNIFKGIRKESNENVAIKVIHNELMENDKIRFVSWTSSVVNINHGSVMKTLDCIVYNGVYHIICLYYEGKNLFDLIKESKTNSWGNKYINDVVVNISNALRALHFHHPRVIHRDIKPSNIIIRTNGTPVIIDFGISLVDLHTNRIETPSERKRGMGTIGYSSPEQLYGDIVDETADIYAMGMTIYDMIVGSPDPVDLVLNRIIQPSNRLKPEQFEVLKKATDHIPSRRYQSAEIFRDAWLKASKPWWKLK